jgi:hypothetical protein
MLTLTGLFFFYAGSIEAKVRNVILSLEVGVSRWYRRVQFLTYKKFAMTRAALIDLPIVIVNYMRLLSY